MRNISRRAFIFSLCTIGTLLESLARPKQAGACDYVDKVNVRIDWREVEIDSCISKMVDALNKGGVKTITSCCGHGVTDGYILCEDYLLVVSKERNKEARNRYLRDWERIGAHNKNVTEEMRSTR